MKAGQLRKKYPMIDFRIGTKTRIPLWLDILTLGLIEKEVQEDD